MKKDLIIPTKTPMSPELINALNYYRWIADVFSPFLGKSILDIGGGFGNPLDFLLQKNIHIVSIELHEDSVQFMKERYKKYPNFIAMHGDFTIPETQKELEKYEFDTVMTVNVLEHIEDDVTFIKNASSLLTKGYGYVLTFTPALPFLYGSVDEDAGHYRRYTKKSLSKVMSQAGLNVEKIFYFNAFGVIPYFINSRILKARIEASMITPQIKIFNKIIPMLWWIEKHLNPPLGQSLVSVAKKQSL